MTFFRRLPRRAPLLAFALAVLVAALPHSTSAEELEPDLVLQGFPFSSAASIAISADGRDIYAAGTADGNTRPVATAGIAWLHRDLESGLLELRGNLYSSPSASGFLGSVLSQSDLYLYCLGEREVITLLRAPDGSLTNFATHSLPPDLVPLSIFPTPAGNQLVVIVHPSGSPEVLRALFYDLGADGRPSLVQILEAAFARESLAALANDQLVSGRVLLRRVGNAWQAGEIPGFAGNPALQAWAVSADRRYPSAIAPTSPAPGNTKNLVSLEWNGFAWVPVSELVINDDLDRLITTLALNPGNGDLVVASVDLVSGIGARIVRYPSVDGGRSFGAGRALVDLGVARARKHRLAFTADGSQLYTNFSGEPMALIEVDPADGTLHPVADAAGRHSHFERPFKALPLPGGDSYILAPAAVIQASFEDGQATVVSSLDREEWTAATGAEWVDLAFTPDGGAAVLTNGADLVLVDRDQRTGVLSILNETNIRSASEIRALELSGDGRYLYATGLGHTRVYFVRRDVPRLVPVQDYPEGGKAFAIAPNGVDVALVDFSGVASFLERDPETGELAAAPGPSRSNLESVLFLADGSLALIGRVAPPSEGTFELLRRGAGGSWSSELEESLRFDPGARLIADADSHYFFLLTGGDLFQLSLAPQFAAFDTLAARFTALHRLAEPSSTRSPNLALEPGDQSLLVTDLLAGNVLRFRRGCGYLAAGPCLAGDRFRLDVIWRAAGMQGPGLPLSYGSDDSQVFSFFDTTNWEVLAKVLDGCAINGRYWVFAAASTDLAYELQVTDTWTGQRQVYRNAAGTPAPAITDIGAFATCDAPSPGWDPPGLGRATLFERPGALRLGSNYEATVLWTTPAGLSGFGNGLEPVPASASGLFYFFSPENWEMQVKVLDGCALNGHRWVFGAATTDVGYQLEVRELSSGRRKIYTNPVGSPSKAITDIEAFGCD